MQEKDTETRWRITTVVEKEVMLYDRIALERHDYAATRAERLQNAKLWVLRLTADGTQEPLRQRHDFAGARCSSRGNRTNSDTDTSTT